MDKTDPPLPEAIPTPARLASELAAVGLEAHVTVQRRDGRPLGPDDLAAVRRIVTGLDDDSGPGFTDEAAEDAAMALALTPAFAPTDATPAGDRDRLARQAGSREQVGRGRRASAGRAARAAAANGANRASRAATAAASQAGPRAGRCIKVPYRHATLTGRGVMRRDRPRGEAHRTRVCAS